LFHNSPFTANTFLATSAAKTIESELQQIKEQIKSISRRVDILEEQNPAKSKRLKSRTSKMGSKK
jgi:Tfp pilus assembly protein PilO